MDDDDCKKSANDHEPDGQGESKTDGVQEPPLGFIGGNAGINYFVSSPGELESLKQAPSSFFSEKDECKQAPSSTTVGSVGDGKPGTPSAPFDSNKPDPSRDVPLLPTPKVVIRCFLCGRAGHTIDSCPDRAVHVPFDVNAIRCAVCRGEHPTYKCAALVAALSKQLEDRNNQRDRSLGLPPVPTHSVPDVTRSEKPTSSSCRLRKPLLHTKVAAGEVSIDIMENTTAPDDVDIRDRKTELDRYARYDRQLDSLTKPREFSTTTFSYPAPNTSWKWTPILLITLSLFLSYPSPKFIVGLLLLKSFLLLFENWRVLTVWKSHAPAHIKSWVQYIACIILYTLVGVLEALILTANILRLHGHLVNHEYWTTLLSVIPFTPHLTTQVTMIVSLVIECLATAVSLVLLACAAGYGFTYGRYNRMTIEYQRGPEAEDELRCKSIVNDAEKNTPRALATVTFRVWGPRGFEQYLRHVDVHVATKVLLSPQVSLTSDDNVLMNYIKRQWNTVNVDTSLLSLHPQEVTLGIFDYVRFKQKREASMRVNF